MQTLSYGYLLPQNPDSGAKFFPAMETNIQHLNDHTHNGTDSALIASNVQTAPAASWVLAPIGGGVYRQLVSIPVAGFNYDTMGMWFKLGSGEYVYPTVERASATSFYIYTNDPALDINCFFR